MLHRQARLRAPYSMYYPGITPGEWHHALWAREMTLSHLRKGGPHWGGEGRVLPEAHFEFQGGLVRRGAQWEVRRLLPQSPTAADTLPDGRSL